MTGNKEATATHTTLNRVFELSIWLLPVVLFFLSGIPKILNPSGTMPAFLAGYLKIESYDLIMRSVGIMELGLAIMVVLPATRRLGLYLLLALVSIFSLFVALNSHDFSFVSHCGCFSALGNENTESPSTYFGALILRNSLIAFVLLIGIRSYQLKDGVNKGLIFRQLQSVVMVFLLVLTVPLAIGELQLRLNSYRALDALMEGNDNYGYFGKVFPNFSLVDSVGYQTNSLRALEENDHLFFLSTSCPHCERLGPSIARYHQGLILEGKRCVLLLTDAQEVSMGFVEHIGLTGVPVYAVPDKNSLLRLGITSVPRMIIIGGDHKVLFNESYPHASTFWKSVNLCEHRVNGVAKDTYDAIAAEIFGDQARCESVPGPREYYYQSPVITIGGGNQQLFVVQGGTEPGALLELAIGIGDNTTIEGIVPVSAGAYIRAIDPSISLVDCLVGLTLPEATAYAKEQAKQPGLEKRIWKSTADGLVMISSSLVTVTHP
jgi:uncharacterized membrane protein YphA (DoxX/SURF4 family)